MSKLSDYSDSFRDQRDILKAINSELGLQKDALQASKKEMSNLESIALKLQNNEEELSKLSQNQLKNLQDKATIALRELKTNVSQLKNKKNLTTEEKALVKQYKSGFAIETKFVGKVKERLELQKKVNKSMGIFGGALKGISKIPIIGDLFDAESALGDMEKSLLNNESSVTAMSKGFQNIGGQVIDGLMNPANIALATFTGILSIFKQLDKEAGEFAKSMNMSYGEALQVRQEMSSLAVSSGDLALNATKLTKTLGEVGAALGTNALLNDKDLKTFTKLTNQAGFTADELMNIQKLSLANGKSLDDNVSSIMGGGAAFAAQNKLALNEKQILKDVNGMSASLKLSLEGGTEALGAAAAQARKFGINLEQAESIASSLLDFESSIENELSAELITGKNLNLERARGLALNGDAVGAASEMLKQVGGTAEFSKMNVIQQEALAKAVGMTREGLAGSLIESESLAAMSAVEGKTALERYNNEIKAGKSKADMVNLLGEEAAAGLEAQSNQEKFNVMVEKLQATFTQIGDVLMPIFDLLGMMMEVVGLILTPVGMIVDGFMFIKNLIAESTPALITFGAVFTAILATQQAIAVQKKISKGMTLGQIALEKRNNIAKLFGLAVEQKKGVKEKQSLMTLIGKAAMTAFDSVAKIPFIGPILGAIAAASAVAIGMKYMSDGVIGPGGETVVSGPKGSIQLDKEDSMIVGTDLGGKNKPGKPSGEGGGSVNVDMSQTNALLQQLIGVIQSGGTVTLDGQAVGAALKLGAFEVQ